MKISSKVEKEAFSIWQYISFGHFPEKCCVAVFHEYIFYKP